MGAVRALMIGAMSGSLLIDVRHDVALLGTDDGDAQTMAMMVR